MQLEILKSKVLKAEVTETHLDYEGSLAMDKDFMDAVGFIPNEKVLVGNIENGNRFETYLMIADPGSKTISINGAAAHLGNVGDLLVIMSYAHMTEEEAQAWQPRVMVLGDHNKTVKELRNGVPHHPHPIA